jgi:ribosomal protein S18 acetylase RimI-like enzyme
MAEQAAIHIRPYRPADRDQVMAIAPRLAEWVASWRDPAAVLAAVQGWVRDSIEALSRPGHAVYVAADGGDVAGLVTVSEHTHFSGQAEAYVGELAVRTGMERRGIASLLMAAAEAWAAGRGLPFLTLETGAANQPARDFYRSLGYQEEDVRLTKAICPTTGPGTARTQADGSAAGT